jgi:hypothetical protein
METICYKGKVYPVFRVDLSDLIDCNSVKTLVADDSLWEDMEEDFYKDDKEAVSVDENIYYYLPKGFLDTNPSYEEVINKLRSCVDDYSIHGWLE